MRSTARWISVLLHPIFMPLITIALAMQVDPHVAYFLPLHLRGVTLMMLGVMTVAFPFTSILLLLRARMITSIHMPTREERVVPYGMMVIYLGMTYYLLRHSPLDMIVRSIMLGMIVALFLTTLITVWWKISIHMVGIGGLLGVTAALAAIHSLPLLPVLAGIILLSGVLGTARMLDGGHTIGQVVGGFALGLCTTYICVVLGVAV